MARKKSLNLTDAELRLMDVLWQKGSATVGEVADALPKELGLAYNTVLTTLPGSWKRKVIWSTPRPPRAALSSIAP